MIQPRTLTELKAAYRNGAKMVQADEYLGDDGLPYCRKCGEARWFADESGLYACVVACKCQHEKYLADKLAEMQRERASDLKKRKALSLLGNRYENATFATAHITESNKEAFEKAKRYVDKHSAVLEGNIGLYIWGNNSTGKTYLTACICNELIARKHTCIYTSLATMLNGIKATYNDRENENVILDRLRTYDFAFIDDIGKEFLGREFDSSKAKWAESKLFEILNERYNAEKPTIFTSNYSIEQLYSVLGLDKAIVSRINEMSTRVIKLDGDNFRHKIVAQKNEIAKQIGL